jgi:hypothetical protein
MAGKTNVSASVLWTRDILLLSLSLEAGLLRLLSDISISLQRDKVLVSMQSSIVYKEPMPTLYDDVSLTSVIRMKRLNNQSSKGIGYLILDLRGGASSSLPSLKHIIYD